MRQVLRPGRYRVVWRFKFGQGGKLKFSTLAYDGETTTGTPRLLCEQVIEKSSEEWIDLAVGKFKLQDRAAVEFRIKHDESTTYHGHCIDWVHAIRR